MMHTPNYLDYSDERAMAFANRRLRPRVQTVVGAEVVYTTAVNMYKISLLFLYFRIFPLPSIRKWGMYCGGISTAWNVACIFAASFQCSPRNKIWEPWVDGFCIDIFLAQLCISIPSILCDIAILCFPLPHILRLKTNLTQKIFLVAIFMLGSYVVFTSIYRFVVYLSYSKHDIPFTLGVPCAWNVIEISSGIVSSCLPTLVRSPRVLASSSFQSMAVRAPALLLTPLPLFLSRAPSSARSSSPSCPRPWAAGRPTRATASAATRAS